MRRLFRQLAQPVCFVVLGVLLTISFIGYLCAENVGSSGSLGSWPTIERLPPVEGMDRAPTAPYCANQGAASIGQTFEHSYSTMLPAVNPAPTPAAESAGAEKGDGKPDDAAKEKKEEPPKEEFISSKSTGPLGLITLDGQYAWVNEVRPDSLLVRTTRYLSRYVGEWEGSVQLGCDGTSGSSETFNVAFGVNGKRQIDIATFSFDIDYKRSNSDGTITADRLFFNCRYEHPYGNGKLNFFVQDEVTYDEFQPWNAQVALSSGVGYYFLKNDITQLQGLWGGGFSQEIGGPDDECVPEMHLGFNGEHKINERQKLVGSSNYYPDASNFNESRIVNKLSWEVLLDEEVNLSMKFNITDRLYCPNPGGKENDLNYSMLLMWKF